MKKSVAGTVMAVAVLFAHSDACYDPMSPFSVGVVFSKGEIVDLNQIEKKARDTTSFVKSCTVAGAVMGYSISTDPTTTPPVDPLTINAVKISLNSLTVEVSYGGGCAEHAISLQLDKSPEPDAPYLDLRLLHDSHNDICEAWITREITFDLASLGTGRDSLIVRVFAPQAEEPYPVTPQWIVASRPKTNNCHYRLRSAYADEVMAYIGVFEGPLQNGYSGYRVLLIFDTTEVPTAAIKAEALAAELQRLASIGVITPEPGFIDHIRETLTAAEGQFWTAEDTVLPFNAWFDGTELLVVKRTYGAQGCGIGVAYSLPAVPFVSTGVERTGNNSGIQRQPKNAITAQVHKSGMLLRFSPVSGSGSHIAITAMNGRVAARYSLESGVTALSTQLRLPAGCYLMTLYDRGKLRRSGRLVVSGY